MYDRSFFESELNRRPIPVDNAVATLVLGILSILSCVFYGIPSLILGIIALAISSGPNRNYKAFPEQYDISSYNLLNAGRVCAIIGVCISGAFWVILLCAFFLAIGSSH